MATPQRHRSTVKIDALIAAIEAANRREPDAVPEGFRCVAELCKESGKGHDYWHKRIRKAIEAGTIRRIEIRCADGRNRPFYGPA